MNRSTSNVVLLDDGSRRGYLPVILPVSSEGNSKSFSPFVASTFLGFREIERKSGDILPFLAQRLKDCDFHLSVEYRDSKTQPVVGAQQLLDTLGRTNDRNGFSNTTTTTTTTTTNASSTISSSSPQNKNNNPFAVLGALISSTTQMLTILGNPFQLPIMSFSATSQDLDYRPYFSRTVPTNAGDAVAIALYLQHLGVTHVGILYIADVWGSAFHLALQNELAEKNITFLSSSLHATANNSDAEASIQYLARSQYKYFIGIVNTQTFQEVFHSAYHYGIMGHSGYTWILTEGGTGADPFFRRDSTFETDVARALHGTARIELQVPTHTLFEQSLNHFATNESLQKDFTNLLKQPELFDGYTFAGGGGEPIELSHYNYFAFDAAIALGIASCETPGQFTGDEFHQQLLQTRFEGVSGSVSFEESGTRALEGFQFRVVNMLLSEERSTSRHYYFSSEVVAEISVGNAASSSQVHVLQDFVYSDNSTVAPLLLPAIDEELNLISTASLIVGFIFGGSVILASTACIIWTYGNRNEHVVRSSQPFFLYQLCIGTTIMALSVIPLSFQEPIPKNWLDVACMSIPWFLLIGFVTAFSAIFCKTRRLNKLLKSAQAFRRIVIHPKDVMIPFLVLISINIVLLLAWGFVDPIHWYRAEGTNYDLFGRNTESHGVCRLGHSYTYLAFAITLAIVDASAILLALRQCHKARHVSVEFSESHYLFLSMASLFETLILAVPLSYASSQNPSAGFVVSSIIVALLCFTILIPIFVPKYMMVKGHDLTSKKYTTTTNTTNSNNHGESDYFSNRLNNNNKPRATNFDSRTPPIK